MCLRSTNPRPRGVKSIYAGVPPVDVREAFTMSDDVAARVDKLRNAPRISAIVLYEVTDDGGALLHLQSAGVRDSGLDLTLFPDGTTDLGI